MYLDLYEYFLSILLLTKEKESNFFFLLAYNCFEMRVICRNGFWLLSPIPYGLFLFNSAHTYRMTFKCGQSTYSILAITIWVVISMCLLMFVYVIIIYISTYIFHLLSPGKYLLSLNVHSKLIFKHFPFIFFFSYFLLLHHHVFDVNNSMMICTYRIFLIPNWIYVIAFTHL